MYVRTTGHLYYCGIVFHGEKYLKKKSLTSKNQKPVRYHIYRTYGTVNTVLIIFCVYDTVIIANDTLPTYGIVQYHSKKV